MFHYGDAANVEFSGYFANARAGPRTQEVKNVAARLVAKREKNIVEAVFSIHVTKMLHKSGLVKRR